MHTVYFDVAYETGHDAPIRIDDDYVRRFVCRYGGKVVYFRPGGTDDSRYGASFDTPEIANACLREFYDDPDDKTY